MYNVIFAAITTSQFRLLGLSITGILTLLTLIITLGLYVHARSREIKVQTSEGEERSVENNVAESLSQSDTDSKFNGDASEVPSEETKHIRELETRHELQPEIIENQPAEAINVNDNKTESENFDGYPEFIKNYLQKLDGSAKQDFKNIVLNNTENLTVCVTLPVTKYGEDETAFVNDYFNSCSKYAKLLPVAIPELLYGRFLELNHSDTEKARARRKLISAYYTRRGEEDTAFKCEELCKEDVAYYLKTMGLRDRALPTLKKLVELCVSQNRFDDAIFWCDTALEYGITEVGGEGYGRRKQRIVLLKERYEIKNSKKDGV